MRSMDALTRKPRHRCLGFAFRLAPVATKAPALDAVHDV